MRRAIPPRPAQTRAPRPQQGKRVALPRKQQSTAPQQPTRRLGGPGYIDMRGGQDGRG